jgi:DNA polymerase-4
MFFVGAATAEKLRGMGIATIGDLARANPLALQALLGKHGPMLHRYVNGMDTEPVRLYGEREPVKSVGNGITFKRNLVGLDDITTAVTSLADTVSTRLRSQRLKAWGIKVDIKDPNFRTIARQKQLVRPTHSTADVKDAALELIQASWRLNNPIRLLTITAINLCDEMADEQLSLFDAPVADREKDESLDKAMDEIRRKFGGSSITFGQMIDNDLV